MQGDEEKEKKEEKKHKKGEKGKDEGPSVEARWMTLERLLSPKIGRTSSPGVQRRGGKLASGTMYHTPEE